jgi:DNA-binding GntR family transcriptional regulator
MAPEWSVRFSVGQSVAVYGQNDLHTFGSEGEVVVAAKTTASARSGAKARALDFVKGQVLTGAFRGGDLITEGEVAEALGMSRTPVREAFLRLEAEGLLRLYPQRGALVIPVSPEEVRAVMEARLVLEQFAVEKIISRGSASCGAIADALAAELERQQRAGAESELSEFLEADRAFHTIFLDNADNSILGSVYASLRDRQLRMISESALRDPRRIETILNEHASITEAVRDGDVGRTVTAVRAHLAGTVLALGLAPESVSSLAWPRHNPSAPSLGLA